MTKTSKMALTVYMVQAVAAEVVGDYQTASVGMAEMEELISFGNKKRRRIYDYY